MKELWCYNKNRISVRFEYEWRDANNPTQWIATDTVGSEIVTAFRKRDRCVPEVHFI
jgi:nuclear transport factor 2 (NTF2) superfamily protein